MKKAFALCAVVFPFSFLSATPCAYASAQNLALEEPHLSEYHVPKGLADFANVLAMPFCQKLPPGKHGCYVFYTKEYKEGYSKVNPEDADSILYYTHAPRSEETLPIVQGSADRNTKTESDPAFDMRNIPVDPDHLDLPPITFTTSLLRLLNDTYQYVPVENHFNIINYFDPNASPITYGEVPNGPIAQTFSILSPGDCTGDNVFDCKIVHLFDNQAYILAKGHYKIRDKTPDTDRKIQLPDYIYQVDSLELVNKPKPDIAPTK